jgi:restriction system protein
MNLGKKTHPKAWKVRAQYAHVEDSISENYSGFIEYNVPDLTENMSRIDIEKLVRTAYVSSTEKRIRAHVGQIFTALNEVCVGDILVIPTQKSKLYTIGIVNSTPHVTKDGKIVFSFSMKREGIPKSIFKQDLRYSFMAIMQICQIKRNSALQRLLQIADGNDDPGYG